MTAVFAGCNRTIPRQTSSRAFVIDAVASEPLESVIMRMVTGLVVALFLTACGGSRHFRTTNAAETTSTPPYLELLSERSVGTLHFPRGVYVLDAVDDNGYYYRAPRKILQHSFSGNLLRNGGIFVAKHDQARLRGYVIMPGGLTHVGNLSRADHEFRY